MSETVAPRDTALQHGEPSGSRHWTVTHGPRPLPLFLELVRHAAQHDGALAKRVLEGLARYQGAQRPALLTPRPALATAGGATLRDHGGSGSPVILVPSLINPPHVLDIPGESLAQALAARHHVLLVDWGPATARAGADLGAHVEQMLVTLVRHVGAEAALVGYCLGGTMAIGAANLTPVARVATLAAPWRFSAYADEARTALARLWSSALPAAEVIGVLPTEVLQLAFWSLDPDAIVAKYACLASEPEDSEAMRRFVSLEDWANDGDPLPLSAARELIEELFVADRTGRGEWRIGGVTIDPSPVPALHFIASADRIVPAASAPPGPSQAVASGHVGMIVGRRAPELLHAPLLDFLN